MFRFVSRSTFAVAAAVALVAASAPAAAAEADEGNRIATAPGASTPTTAREKRYCFMADQTASRIPQKVCKTRKEWEAEGVEIPAGR